MIDLHSHSTASDGLLSPADSARYAASCGLSVWALTDHDTVSGLAEADAAANSAGVTFVPGIELNIEWPTGEFHLLGLGLKQCSQQLESVIARLQSDRTARNEQIVEKMNADGVPVTLKEIQDFFHTQLLGRPHFAEYLVFLKKVKRRQDAFDRYLAKGRPWYADRAGADLDEAVSAIVSSGGIPVLAHPLSLYVSWGKIEPVLAEIRTHGVEGLEAYHPGAREGEAVRLEAMAHRLGYFVTAGSDFHGEGVRADRHLGKTSGGKKIEDRFWTEELLPHLPSFDGTFTV
jgi:predicted metal-dependent phosphoesterase TrpH